MGFQGRVVVRSVVGHWVVRAFVGAGDWWRVGTDGGRVRRLGGGAGGGVVGISVLMSLLHVSVNRERDAVRLTQTHSFDTMTHFQTELGRGRIRNHKGMQK